MFLVVTVATSVGALGVVLTPVCLLGGATAWRAARRASGSPADLAAGPLLAGVALIGLAPLGAVVSPPAGVVALLAGAAVVAWQTAVADRGEAKGGGAPIGPAAWRAVLAAAVPGLAGLALVIAADQSSQAALVLVVAVCLFDLANAVMGTGETGGIVGAVAGLLTLAVLAVIVESVLVPPFTSTGAWLLCGAVAVAAPLGVEVCRRLAPGRVPALRRLDSLVVSGPLWIAGAAVLVHH